MTKAPGARVAAFLSLPESYLKTHTDGWCGHGPLCVQMSCHVPGHSTHGLCILDGPLGFRSGKWFQADRQGSGPCDLKVHPFLSGMNTAPLWTCVPLTTSLTRWRGMCTRAGQGRRADFPPSISRVAGGSELVMRCEDNCSSGSRVSSCHRCG